jgi:hypothetical protein
VIRRRTVRNNFPRCETLSNFRATALVKNTLQRRRILFKRLADARGPRRKNATAIRAASAEPLFDAGRAERALERTNPRPIGIGRQIDIATLATGAHLEHGGFSLMNIDSDYGLRRCAVRKKAGRKGRKDKRKDAKENQY